MRAARITIVAACAGIALAGAFASSAKDRVGRITTLERGRYHCEMPGDAAIARGISVPEEDFTVTNGSAYSAQGKNGTYLRTDDTVTITSGPKKGERYIVKNERYLRKVDAHEQPTGLRCIHHG